MVKKIVNQQQSEHSLQSLQQQIDHQHPNSPIIYPNPSNKQETKRYSQIEALHSTLTNQKSQNITKLSQLQKIISKSNNLDTINPNYYTKCKKITKCINTLNQSIQAIKILHALNKINPGAFKTRSPNNLLKFALKTIDDDINSREL